VVLRRHNSGALTPALSRGEREIEPAKKPSPSGRGLGEGGQAAPALARRGDTLASKLRQSQTDVERKLWFALRDRRLCGAKFRRQAPIAPYVVDFLCLDARIIIELDGGQHGGDQDVARHNWRDYRVLRFWNNEVLENFDGVLAAIADALTPALSRRERELKPSPSGRGLGEGCQRAPTSSHEDGE
jgi:adenine-specific DNA-methyltransferase